MQDFYSPGGLSLEFESQKNFTLEQSGIYETAIPYDYQQKDSLEQMTDEFDRCESQNECCVFTVDYNINKKSIISRPAPEAQDPSVIALYATNKPGDKQCATHLFSELKRDGDLLKKIREQIRQDLEYSRSATFDANYRPGGLLPKYLAEDADAPGNNYPRTNISSCDIRLAYPNAKKEFLEDIAENIKSKFSDKGIKMEVEGLDKDVIEEGEFTILLDSEMFYTMNDNPTLYKYLLTDPDKGRDVNPFDDEDCGKCFLVARERVIKGDLSYYYDAGFCDKRAVKWANKCGISVNDNKLNDPAALLIELEQRFQSEAKNPIFHLYYFGPLRISTSHKLGNGTSCQDAAYKTIASQ